MKVSLKAFLSILFVLSFGACARIGFLPISFTGSSSGALQSATGGVPVTLAISGPESITAGTCSGPYLVLAQDGNGLPTPLPSQALVTLSGAGKGHFYSTSSCSQATSTVTPSKGIAQFFFQDGVGENLTFTATIPEGLQGTINVSVNAAAPAGILVQGPSAFPVTSCAPFIIQLVDSMGNPTVTAVNETVQFALSGSASSGASVFSNSTCTVGASSTVVGAGTSSNTVYLSGTTAGPLALTATASGIGTGHWSGTLLAGTAQKIVLSGATNNVVGTCVPVTAQLEDSENNLTTLASDVPLTLTTNSQHLQFFTNSGCAGPVTSTTLSAGQSSTGLFVKDTTAEATTIYAASTGLTTGSLGQTFIAGPPASISVQLTYTTLPAGSCGVADVALFDSYGNSAVASQALSSTMSASSSTSDTTTFYSDSNCQSATQTVTVPNGTHAQAFSFITQRPTTSETLTATPPTPIQAGSVQLVVTTAEGVPFQISISGPQSIQVGSCAQYKVGGTDRYGNPVEVEPALDLTLSSTAGNNVIFYSDSGCSTPATDTTIDQGNESSTFYLRTVLPLNFNISAKNTADALAASYAITSVVGPATQLSLPSAATVGVGQCAQTTVQLLDSFKNPTTASSNVQVSLSSSQITGSSQTLSFYSDPNCTQSASSVTIASGTGSEGIYFSGGVLGTANLTSSATGLTSAREAITIVERSGVTLSLQGPASVTTDDCQAYQVILTHSSAVVPVQVTYTSTGSNPKVFFRDSKCQTQDTGDTLSDSSSTAVVYFQNTIPGQYTITANGTGGLTSGLTVNDSAGAAAKIVISGGPGQVLVNQCGSGYVATLQDEFGNATVSPSGISLSLSESGVSGVTFSAGSSCGAGATSISIGSGNGSTAFSLTSTGTGTMTVSVSGSGLTTGQATVTILPNSLSLVGGSLSFGQVAVNTSKTLPFTLENTGPLAIGVSSYSVTGAGFSVVSGGSCASSGTALTLAGGASCTINVQFAPTAATGYSGNLVVNSVAGQVSGGLSGTGVTPGVLQLIGANSINFGNINIHTTQSQSLTVGNGGQTTLTLSGISLSGSELSITGGSCTNGMSLSGGASCTVQVQFAPVTAGPASGSLTVTSTGGSAVGGVSGNGVIPGTLAFNPGNGLNFGDFPFPGTRGACMQVTNVGQEPAAFTGFAFSLGSSYFVDNGVGCPSSCVGATIAPNESCYVPVRFTPPSPGVQNDVLNIAYTSNGQSLGNNFGVTGSATLPLTCQIQVNSASIVVDTWGNPYARSSEIDILAVASRNANYTGYTFNGGGFAPFWGGAPGANSVLIKGTTAAPGTFSGTVSMVDANNGNYTATCSYTVVVSPYQSPVVNVAVNGSADGDDSICLNIQNGNFDWENAGDARWAALRIDSYTIYRADGHVDTLGAGPSRGMGVRNLNFVDWPNIVSADPDFTYLKPTERAWPPSDWKRMPAWSSPTRPCIALLEGAGGKPGPVDFVLNLGLVRN